MEYIIYKIINKVNNKVYIGQTINFKERVRSHRETAFRKSSREYNKPLYRAMRKYGLENFEIKIIDDSATSFEELNEKEIYYIQKYNSCVDYGCGYNLDKGGKNGLKSDYTKNKISEAHKGYGGGSFGKKGGEAYRAKKIMCLETGVIYPSAIDCAQDLFPSQIDSARKQISKCATPHVNRFKYKGYSFRFLDKNGEIIEKTVSPMDVSKNAKGIKIVNLTTNEVYASIKEAKERTGMSYSMIRDRIYNRVKDEKNILMVYEDFIANEEALTGNADGNLVPSLQK